MKHVATLVLLICLLCGQAACTPKQATLSDAKQPTLSEDDKEAIRAEIERGSRHEMYAAEFAEKHGAKAVPFLIEMFQTQDAEVGGAKKSTIAFCLGKFRDSRAVRPMVDFIERPLAQEMTEDQLNAILGTMLGLGFIGDEVSLEYLRRFASEDYWLNRPVHPRVPEVSINYPYHKDYGMSEQDTRRKFREYALEGLGLVGNKKAIEILEELKEGAAKDIDVVGTWLREAKRRQKDGPPWTWVHYDKYGRRYRVTP